MFDRIRAAIAAFIAPEMIQTPAATAEEATDNTTGAVCGQATAVQTRDISGDLTVDRSTTHTGPTVTNTNNGGQTGDVSGGIVNIGGSNRFSGTAVGRGATVNNVGTNTGGMNF